MRENQDVPKLVFEYTFLILEFAMLLKSWTPSAPQKINLFI
jgi:hypothetical protein